MRPCRQRGLSASALSPQSAALQVSGAPVELEEGTRKVTWQFHAPSSRRSPSLSRCVPRVRGGRCGVRHGPLGACGGSARLREAGWQVATPTVARQPYLFCPVLHRALCSGSRAFSRLVCVRAVEGWWGTCRGLARLREAGWQVAPSTAPGNPTCFAPSCTAHSVLLTQSLLLFKRQ